MSYFDPFSFEFFTNSIDVLLSYLFSFGS